jgi:hypothetical protein
LPGLDERKRMLLWRHPCGPRRMDGGTVGPRISPNNRMVQATCCGEGSMCSRQVTPFTSVTVLG